MKKIFTVIVAALVAVAANAQFYAGGRVGCQTGDNGHIKVAPEAGYNFNDEFAVGAAVDFYSQKDAYSTLGINPYVRWTFAEWAPLRLFLDGSFEFQSVSVDKNWNQGESKTYSLMQLGIKPGISCPINENLSVVAHLGFVGFTAVDDDIRWLMAGEYEDGFTASFSGNYLGLSLYYSF